MNINNILQFAVASFFVLWWREAVKGRLSAALGDPTPARNGMLGGNPFTRIEPIGYILCVVFGFGWGRPTPTSPIYYKDKKKGQLIVHGAPALFNLITGILAIIIFSFRLPVLLTLADNGLENLIFAANWLFGVIIIFARVSINVAIFNLIPVAPLDASKLLTAFARPDAALRLSQNEKILQLILMFLVIFGLVSMAINPITNFIVRIFS